jgi:hypothetical protein
MEKNISGKIDSKLLFKYLFLFLFVIKNNYKLLYLINY